MLRWFDFFAGVNKLRIFLANCCTSLTEWKKSHFNFSQRRQIYTSKRKNRIATQPRFSQTSALGSLFATFTRCANTLAGPSSITMLSWLRKSFDDDNSSAWCDRLRFPFVRINYFLFSVPAFIVLRRRELWEKIVDIIVISSRRVDVNDLLRIFATVIWHTYDDERVMRENLRFSWSRKFQGKNRSQISTHRESENEFQFFILPTHHHHSPLEPMSSVRINLISIHSLSRLVWQTKW